MHLITMAHLGEAQGVIERFNLKKNEQDTYSSEDMVLLITGEGPFEAATKTALNISKWNIKKISNLGIAGSLNAEYEVGTIHPVRTIYLIQDLKPQFKTFQSFEKGIDCITSFERILDPEKAKALKGIGELIDRESWGVAFAAKAAGIPFKSWKLISDIAGTLDACELVKDKAEAFSKILADHLATESDTKVLKTETELEGFFFTFTSGHRFNDLLKKLSIKEEKSEEEILKLLPVGELQELKLSPKERAKRLISAMEDLVDPLKGRLEIIKKAWQKPFEDAGFKVMTDPQWENPEVQISFSVKKDSDLKEKADILSKMSLEPFQRMLSGDFHVE